MVYGGMGRRLAKGVKITSKLIYDETAEAVLSTWNDHKSENQHM